MTSILASAAVAVALAAGDAQIVGQHLRELYPKTEFSEVKETPIPGIYEVVMGKNVAYVDGGGRYFIFGALYDMQSQKDLTSQRRAALDKIVFEQLPLNQAIKIKKGNGKRQFALFSDPDCPFCRRLEETIAGMTDYTVYVFMYPIDGLHPQAKQVAKDIWCSKDKVKAYGDYMLLERKPGTAPTGCDSRAIEENIELAEKLNIRGTPTIIHSSGRKVSGALPRTALEQFLNGE